MTNPFEELADAQRSAYSKRKERDAARRAVRLVVMSDADAPMKGNAMEQARDRRNAEMKNYRDAKARDRDELLAGPYGRQVAELVVVLKGLTMGSAGELVERVMQGAFSDADRPTRQGVLSLIGDAIMKLRVRSGLAPFDDPLMGQDANAFLLIRKELLGV